MVDVPGIADHLRRPAESASGTLRQQGTRSVRQLGLGHIRHRAVGGCRAGRALVCRSWSGSQACRTELDVLAEELAKRPQEVQAGRVGGTCDRGAGAEPAGRAGPGRGGNRRRPGSRPGGGAGGPIALTDDRGRLLLVSAARPGRTSEITACRSPLSDNQRRRPWPAETATGAPPRHRGRGLRAARFGGSSDAPPAGLTAPDGGGDDDFRPPPAEPPGQSRARHLCPGGALCLGAVARRTW
jgi:hypothetical protein